MTPPAVPESRLRADIQALRAVAVCGVVFFHLWPGQVRGGYVGVDVFFVISGYLITAHLLGEIAVSGRVRLGAFWARRMRRLLPAALLVLAATTVATYLLLPASLWAVHFREIVASALYCENWVLAADSVDYLNAANAPSAVQHYWSLSVEEQFYVVWPLLLLVATTVAGARTRVRVISGVLALVFAASLVASVVTTAESPGPAYFVTYVRAWEFAAGGLVATLPALRLLLPGGAIRVVRGAGWALVLGAVLLYTQTTPFPGWTAIVPVGGTALVIWAGDARTGLAARLARTRPVQLLGTTSYSLYLWHWPLIVLGAYAVPGSRSLPGTLAVLGLAVVLATVTYRWVENPFRFAPFFTHSQPRTFLVGMLAAASVAVAAFAGIAQTRSDEREGTRQASALLREHADCFGAAAVLGPGAPCSNPALAGQLIPRPAARLEDTGGAYACYDSSPGARLRTCTYGSRQPDALRVALVGDSHGASLVPGLRRLARGAGWRLDTYVGRGCTWSTTAGGEACAPHRKALQDRFENGPRYDLVIVTQRRDLTLLAGDPNPAARSMADAWRPVLARGTRVVAVADNPLLPAETYDCLNRAAELADAQACTMTRAQAFGHSDPLAEAVRLAGAGAHLVDLSRAYCDGDTCPTVIGNVIVYRDEHHLTATFSRTLAPYLVAGIEKALGARGQTGS